ncbi:hypothetical protein BYT27DRAFT_6764092 [Phlegmacium glaucopus]|nr:hypothetical protein BYT27DRAFT_6764092 [Phlegmacium glaucopus]
MSQTSFLPIPPSELGGAIAVNIFAILSTLGLVSVALRVTWLLIRQHLLLTVPEVQEHVFFNTQLGQYAACLLIAMAFSATSGIIGITWVAQRGITEGWVCRFQATLLQIATWGAGYFTVTIAVHTFNSLVLRRRQSVILCRSTMSIGWIIAILAGLIPFALHQPDGHVYGVDKLACGVRSVYPKVQFLLHLLPILIGSFLSAIFFSLIFLVLRGTLKIRGGIKLTLNPDKRWGDNSCDSEEQYYRFIARVAKSMLWYPVAYIVFLVPYSIVRLLDISGFVVPFEATVFGFVCWFSLGIVDVLLLYNTFYILSPVFDTRSTRASMESFYTTGRLQKSPRAPSMSWKKRISQYHRPDFSPSRLVRQDFTVTNSKSFIDPVPLYLDQSLTTHLEDRIEDRANLSSSAVGRSITPAFDYNHIITPPPSASLSSRSNMERHDREDSPILAAGLPVPPRQPRFVTALLELHQSLGMYDDFVSSNEPVTIRQQSAQTFGNQDSSRSRISSWALNPVEMPKWTTRNSQLYNTLPETNEGQERLLIPSSPDRFPLSVSPPLSPYHLRRLSLISTTSFSDPGLWTPVPSKPPETAV